MTPEQIVGHRPINQEGNGETLGGTKRKENEFGEEVSSKKKVLDQKGSGEAGGKGQICDRNEEEVKYPQSQPTKKGAAKGFIFLSRI